MGLLLHAPSHESPARPAIGMNRSKAVAALLLTMIIWGIGPVFIRSMSVNLGPANALVIRYMLVSTIYLAGLWIMGGRRIAREHWLRLLFISLVGIFGYNLGSVFGFERVPAGVGGLIIGTQPLLIAFLATILAREPLAPAALVGLALASAGTALLFWHNLLGVTGDASLVLGGIFIFLSGVAWSFYVVLSRPLIQTYGVYPVTAISIAIGTLPILFLASHDTWTTIQRMGRNDWGQMFYMVVLSTLLATISWNYGVGRLPAATAGAFLYFVPVIAVIAGALILGEPITFGTLAGGALILSGVGIAQGSPRLRMDVRRR